MSSQQADVVICGAGIAGVTAAYELAVKRGAERVILVDERPPLSLTSDKSTEAYRNWWPGPDGTMIQLMNRSIDLLEQLAAESGNCFRLNRRGYLYVTADPAQARRYREMGQLAAEMGAGPLRVHAGQPDDPIYQPADPEAYANQPTGADLFLDQTLIRRHFPYVNRAAVAALHARRCGWFSGQQLGAYLLEQAKAAGAKLVAGRVTGVNLVNGRVESIQIVGENGPQTIQTPIFVNAAGPHAPAVAEMMGVTLPIFSERHLKLSFKDSLGCVPRHAPLLIWDDPQRLNWSAEEAEFLAETAETSWLLEALPAGVHGRPEGADAGQILLILWPYHAQTFAAPQFPLPDNPEFPEIALRGMARLIPGLQAYLERLPNFYVDGGYYSKTVENRPLICPLPVKGAYLLAALSGYGLMAACAAAELLADHITGGPLPGYAPAFDLARYDDPAYQQLLASAQFDGQL